MTLLSKAMIVSSVGMLLWGSMALSAVSSEQQEKEGGSEKSPSRHQQHPGDNQPAPSKPSTESKSPEKDSGSEKSPSRTQHHPAPADGQPAPSKPSTESKPPEKDSGSEKSPSRTQHHPAPADGQPAHPKTPEPKPQSQPAPATKADAPPTKGDTPPESEVKEKEPSRKTLGSLILSVKLALMADPKLFHYDIEAENDQQTVTLTGRVSTEEEKTAATEITQAVQGVKTVVNKLAVEKDLAKALVKKQDEILTALIKDRFSKSATLKAANFEVKTEDGIVQLNGTVRFQVIALEAAEAARQVPGVRAVNTEKIRLEGES
ncbi:MAG: hypothetical protein A4E19_05480 [Nitrospira sp. SG-bin1]|nr:MAG: hypothetical protein A4E19_05480 [Nitrospira sp. SG-bin1]